MPPPKKEEKKPLISPIALAVIVVVAVLALYLLVHFYPPDSDAVRGEPTSILATIQKPLAATELPGLFQRIWTPETYDRAVHDWTVFVAVSMVISFPLLALIIYCWLRIFQIRQRERAAFRAASETVIAKDVPKTHLRWNRIMEQANSDNEHSRRLAILEADIMLNELLDVLGYKGETMAEKMKQVARADWNTIDEAWEAHRMRNKVAHEGAAEPLSGQDVQHTMHLYEKVFREFKYID